MIELRFGIPEDFRRPNQWLVWRLEKRQGKWTKVPYQARGRGPWRTRASTTDAGTWAPFMHALAVVERGKADGLGFVFTENRLHRRLTSTTASTPTLAS